MSEAGSSADAPAVKLWGVCALIGHHLPEAGPCAQHAPCDCSALDARHLRFHPRCSFCEPTKQRSEVWPALTGMIPCGDVMLTEADGRKLYKVLLGPRHTPGADFFTFIAKRIRVLSIIRID